MSETAPKGKPGKVASKDKPAPRAALPPTGGEEASGGKAAAAPRGPPPGVPRRWGKADSDAARAAATADARITPVLSHLKVPPCDRLVPVEVQAAGIAPAIVKLCAAMYTENSSSSTAPLSHSYLFSDDAHLAQAWLAALAEGFKAYKKPEGAVFAWHLNGRITEWLKFFNAHGKQNSLAVANVTRFVQSVVSRVPAATAEEEAKASVLATLASYGTERIDVADGIAAAAVGSAQVAGLLKAGAVVSVWEPSLTAPVVAVLKAAHANAGGAGLTVRLITNEGRGVGPVIGSEAGARASPVTALTQAGIAVAAAPYSTAAAAALAGSDALVLGVTGAVLGDGSLLTAAGAGGLVALASSLAKPVLAVAETFKLSEVFAPDAAAVNALGPAAVVAAGSGAPIAIAPPAELKKAADAADGAPAARQPRQQQQQQQAPGGSKGKAASGGSTGAPAPPMLPFVSGGLSRQAGGDALVPGGIAAVLPGVAAAVVPAGVGPEVPRQPSLVGSWALVKGLALLAPVWDLVRPCSGMTLVTEVGVLPPADAPAVLQVFAALEQAPEEGEEGSEEEEEEEEQVVVAAEEGEEEEQGTEEA